MTFNEMVRLIGYAAAVALGLFCVIYGAMTENNELIGSGLALVTTGGVASININHTGKHGG